MKKKRQAQQAQQAQQTQQAQQAQQTQQAQQAQQTFSKDLGGYIIIYGNKSDFDEFDVYSINCREYKYE